jgi:hypothetical protein
MLPLTRSNSCTSCRSTSIRRSRRRGPVDFLLHFLLRVNPYRCEACDKRFYRVGHSQRNADSPTPKHAH